MEKQKKNRPKIGSYNVLKKIKYQLRIEEDVLLKIKQFNNTSEFIRDAINEKLQNEKTNN